MKRPISNGLVNVTGEKTQKERGFNCMQLIVFLTRDNVKEWEKWHAVHIQAEQGKCPYKSVCHIYHKTIKIEK